MLALDVCQRRCVAGVGERIEVDDFIVAMLAQPVASEVTADEPCAAGDENPHQARSATAGLTLLAPRSATRLLAAR